jgi:hypothetical protein
MTPEETIRMKELYDALDWIVTHLDHRPGLREASNLVTRCERDSLRRVRDAASTDLAKPRGYDVLATGYEVALIGRLPVDRVSSEVESYIYAMRAEIETQAAELKGIHEALSACGIAGINDEFHGPADAFRQMAARIKELEDTLRTTQIEIEECDEQDGIDTETASRLRRALRQRNPYEGETPFGIMLDGGYGDNL